MNQIEIFNSPEFGSIRTLEQNGKVLFCGTDVATALGYTNPRKAVRDHTRGGTKCSIGVQTGKKADGSPAVQMVEMLFIPEGDLYRLIAHSKLPSAERFEQWVFDEVLPAIRKHGAYAMSVEFSAWKQEYTLLLKGQMTHRATLGTDPRGNLTRIDNALAQMPQRLEAAKAQLDNLYQQQAAAKEEVGKPFLYEEELRSKNARLVELDTLLNIDGKGPAHAEAVVAKSTRPSVLDHLKRPVPPRSTDKKPKQHEEVR